MSYAKNAAGHDDPTPFNHFVIFDELNVLACHDYKVKLLTISDLNVLHQGLSTGLDDI